MSPKIIALVVMARDRRLSLLPAFQNCGVEAVPGDGRAEGRRILPAIDLSTGELGALATRRERPSNRY